MGTTIASNLKTMEDDLKKCPDGFGQTGGLGFGGNQGGKEANAADRIHQIQGIRGGTIPD